MKRILIAGRVLNKNQVRAMGKTIMVYVLPTQRIDWRCPYVLPRK